MAEIIARDAKFADPTTTADGKPRASVAPTGLTTLWVNTGTLCNLTCENCYIESSPTNDRLAYISRAEVRAYLDEIAGSDLETEEIGFTGGEPFMNPDIMGMLEDSLGAGHRVLVLTNAMRPMMKHARGLLALGSRYGDALTLRVSVDHFEPDRHRQERGPRSWRPMMEGLRWLSESGFAVHIAGRTRWGEDEHTLRAGFAALFAAEEIAVDAHDPASLVLPGDGHQRRCARDHHRMLGSAGTAAGGSDVRKLSNGGQAQGGGNPRGGRVHAAALRRALRHGPYAGFQPAAGRAEPSPLRQVLRPRRRELLGVRRR